MDERALAWLWLLPSDVRFSVHGAAPKLPTALLERLAPNPNAFLGWGIPRSQLPAPERYESIVLINSPGISVEHLRRLGFPHTLSWSVLPSLADPRVFAPLGNALAATHAIDLISVHKPLARVKRAMTSQIARLGQLGRVGDRVTLARRDAAEVERWLATATGVSRLHLAIAPGSISHKRKVTLQVMSADGQVIGFAKLAASPAARAATERESAWLRELSGHALLVACVPRLVRAVTLGDAFVSLLSPGPAGHSPRAFGARHWDFLRSLESATQTRLRFERSAMWANLTTSLSTLEPRLTSAWRSRLSAFVQRLGVNLGPIELTLSVAHRDFQPGNMCQFADGRLFVYDWEGAQRESTPLYDLFNFTFLDAVPRHGARMDLRTAVLDVASRWGHRVDKRLLPMLFAAYLADHTVRRLTNSDLSRDARSVLVLEAIADLLDRRAEWLQDAPSQILGNEGRGAMP